MTAVRAAASACSVQRWPVTSLMCAALRTLDKIQTRLLWGKVIWEIVSSGLKLWFQQRGCRWWFRLHEGGEAAEETRRHEVSSKNSERWQNVWTSCQLLADNQSRGLYPACAAVYLFFIRHKDSVFWSNQSQTTWQHGGPAFPCFWMWRSFVHVNDPFIVLITDANHRSLPPTAPTACSEPLVCMRDHMWYGGSFTPFYPSIICVSGSPSTYWIMHSEPPLVWGSSMMLASPGLVMCELTSFVREQREGSGCRHKQKRPLLHVMELIMGTTTACL